MTDLPYFFLEETVIDDLHRGIQGRTFFRVRGVYTLSANITTVGFLSCLRFDSTPRHAAEHCQIGDYVTGQLLGRLLATQ